MAGDGKPPRDSYKVVRQWDDGTGAIIVIYSDS